MSLAWKFLRVAVCCCLRMQYTWILSRQYISRVTIICCSREKGKKGGYRISQSCLGHILLSRCYFATRFKRGNIVKPGWFLWHRKENPPWSSMKIIIDDRMRNRISLIPSLEIIFVDWNFIEKNFSSLFVYFFFYNFIIIL